MFELEPHRAYPRSTAERRSSRETKGGIQLCHRAKRTRAVQARHLSSMQPQERSKTLHVTMIEDQQ